jgi:uncharacterized membrane protein
MFHLFMEINRVAKETRDGLSNGLYPTKDQAWQPNIAAHPCIFFGVLLTTFNILWLLTPIPLIKTVLYWKVVNRSIVAKASPISRLVFLTAVRGQVQFWFKRLSARRLPLD